MAKTRLQLSSEGTSRVCGRSLTLASMCFLYYLVKEDFSSNEGPNPSLKGDNNEIVKVHYQCSKNPLRNPWTSFNKPLHKIYLSEGNSNLFSERSYLSLQNSENALSTIKKSSAPEPLDLFQPHLS